MLKIFRVEFVIHFFLFLNSKLTKKKKKSLHPSKIKRDTRLYLVNLSCILDMKTAASRKGLNKRVSKRKQRRGTEITRNIFTFASFPLSNLCTGIRANEPTVPYGSSQKAS